MIIIIMIIILIVILIIIVIIIKWSNTLKQFVGNLPMNC